MQNRQQALYAKSFYFKPFCGMSKFFLFNGIITNSLLGYVNEFFMTFSKTTQILLQDKCLPWLQGSPASGQIRVCLICGEEDLLFLQVRKMFPQLRQRKRFIAVI